MSKDGIKLDDKVIEAGVPTGTGTQGVYTYYANIGGESNVPIFVTYIDSVFSGATSDMVQLKYTWLIDTKITEVKSADTYGLLQVVSTSPDEVKFENNYYINLASNSTINLAGNIKFNVIGNATNLNFFTTVEPRLNITASYESIPVGIATNVIFTVTSKGSPISAATVSLGGAAVGNGVTQTNGQASMSINAAYNGTIIVEAEKLGYAKGTTAIKVYSPQIAGIASWNLQENYVLKLIAIDVRTAPRQAWLQLSKNGILIEDSMVTEGSKFSYCPSACTFNTTVDLIFSGTQGDLIRFTNISQNSEINGSSLSINSTYLMRTADFSGISWALTEGYDLKLIDIDSRANPRRIWLELLKNSTVKEDIFLEEGETFNYTNNSKIIEGKVDAIFSGTQGYLVKLINVSQFSESGSAILSNNETHLYKSTTFSGISWSLNGSYKLTMMDIDAKTIPHQVWFEFSKNNTILDDSVVYSNSYYTYSSGSVTLNSKIDAIFSNLYSGVVMLKEVDLSENGTVILNNSSNSFISGAINRSDYALAEGYNLSLLGVEAIYSPRQAWIRIYKDNNQKDEKIVTYMDKYVYYNSSGNIVLYAEVDSIFSGASQDMVQFRNVTQFSELDGRELINEPKITIATNYSQSPSPTPTPTPTPTPDPTTTPSPDGNIKCEIRGTVYQDPASIPAWDAGNFAGFYYDIKNNISTELLNFIQPLGTYIGNRSIGKNQLEYTTTKSLVQFKANEQEGVEIMNVSGAGVTAYQVVGWQAEKWIAVNGKSNKTARLAFEMGKDDKKTLTTGETWALGAGYEMTINSIDARTTPRQVVFTLKKDGAIIDQTLGQAPQSSSVADRNKAVYGKTKNILGENSLLFTIYVDTIFSGATSDMVQFKYAWLVDESSAIEIKNGDHFGVFEVKSADTDYIKLTNVDPVNLSINMETTLMGNMKFRVADNSSVIRFYPIIEHTIPGVYEIRGRVADTTITPSWDAQTFAGFYYDIDDDVGSERLTLKSPVNNRNIPDKNIIYSTSPQEVSFTYSPFGKYQVIGFMAEKYFAGYTINTSSAKTSPTTIFVGKSAISQGQLHKVLMDDSTKRTISVGETFALKEGYVLKAIDIDINARTILFSLLKDGNEVDNSTLAADQTYIYSKTVGGVEDLPLIMFRFDSVFSGQELQVAFLKGIFQISDNPTSVKVSDRFDNMEVTSVSINGITMSNGGSLVLTKNTEQLLMGNLKFKIADNDALNFYPKINYIISDVTQPPYYPYISINQGKIYTNSRSVALSLSATHAFEMSIKNESYGWTPWETFEDTKSWTLSNGDGLKTVYFKAKNNVGESSIISYRIILDTVRPVVNITGLVNNTTLRFNENIVTGEVLDANLESATLIVKNETLAIVSQYDLRVSNYKFLERVEFAPGQNNTLELNAKDKAGNSNITSIKVIVKNNFNQTIYNVTTSDPVNIDARNETDTDIKFISKINKTNVTITITAITNETHIQELNGSAFALSKEMAVGKIVEVNMSGLNASNESEVGSVIITMYYNKADLDLNGDGMISSGDLDENYLFIYWLNTTNGNWTKLLKDNPAWVIDSGRTKISGSSQGNVWVKVRHLSTFGLAAGLVPKPTDDKSNDNPGSGGGGGGGGGGGSSDENYTNIEVVEKYDMQISKDALTSYRFTHAKNPIMFVNITGNTSLGIITASIEVLKNTSTLVKTAPEGLVYKNTNIWVGTSGYATPKNIKQALIKFRIDNEWMSANGVSGSDIALVKWDGSAWMKLETSESSKDDSYTYFEAKTQTFSHFAIISLKGEKSARVYAAVMTETPAKQTSTPTAIPTKGMPGFEIVTAITAIYMLSRRRK